MGEKKKKDLLKYKPTLNCIHCMSGVLAKTLD